MPFRVPQKIHCSSHPRPLSSSPDLGRGYNIVYNPICTLYNMYMYIYISVCVYYDVIGCNYVYNIYIYLYYTYIYNTIHLMYSTPLANSTSASQPAAAGRC